MDTDDEDEDLNGLSEVRSLLEKNESSALTEKVHVDKKRWFILFVFSMNNVVNGILFMALSGVNSISARYYKVDAFSVELLTNMILIGFVILALPASYAISKWGVRPLLVLASTLQLTTTVIQYTAADSDRFWLLSLTQLLPAVSTAVILQIPGKLSSLWFPEQERATSTSIAVAANIVGCAIGFLSAGLFIRWSADEESMKSMFQMFYLARLIVALAINILTLAYKERPPSPPTAVSSRPFIPFRESLHRLWGNVDFIFLALSYGIYGGLYCAVSPLVNPIVTEQYPSGYGWMIGMMGSFNNLLSVFAFVVVGRLIDRFHLYKLTSVGLLVISMMVWLVFFVILMNTDLFSLLFGLYILFGVFCLPMMAVSIEHAAQMTYPVGEETSTAVLIILSNLFGLFFMYLFGYAAQSGYISLAGYTVASGYLIGALVMGLTRTELNRLDAEQSLK